jgi:hypothetical protein
MLLPSGTGTGQVDISVMVGINIIPRVRDAITSVGVIAKASAAADRFARVGVARNPSGAAMHHSSLSVVSCFPCFRRVISCIRIAHGAAGSPR